MKKLAFPVCSQNLLRIDEYAVHKFINPISSDIYFARIIGNIVIKIGSIGNITGFIYFVLNILCGFVELAVK